MDVLKLNREQFLTAIKSNWNTFKNEKDNTTSKIADYLIEFGLTDKVKGSLITKSKEALKKEALSFEEPTEKKASAKAVSSGADGMASSLVDFLEEIKMSFRESKFNRFLKNRAIKSIEKLMNKIEDTEKLEKLGNFGNVLIVIITTIDVFVDFSTLPKRLKAFREKKKNLVNEQQNQNK